MTRRFTALSQFGTKNARNESFNGAELSESILARDWHSPEEEAACLADTALSCAMNEAQPYPGSLRDYRPA